MRLNNALAVVIAVGLCSGCDNTECGEGTELRDDRCVISDSSDGGTSDASVTCGPGTVLDDGECVPARAKKPIGSACVASAECESGTCLPPADDLPGGFCTILSCGMDNPCPLGTTCYQLNNSTRLCMNYCDREAECREDYHCQPLYTTALNVCAPSCEVSGACLAGARCNTESGLCEIAECEVGASSGCLDQETCIADRDGLSSMGGLCLHLCDPAKPEETCAVDNGDVCQPMADDPSMGFCAPPVCSSTPECPAGADCEASKCMPPPICDSDSPCADDRTCVAGKCMRKCPSDGACSDLHPGLVCADSLPTPACLPLGSYPGSECRPGETDRCDSLGGKPMVCQDNVCLADCSSGGDALCGALSPNLQCARAVFATDVCLPRGSFPGSGCGADSFCAQNLYDNPNVDMKCVDAICVVDCSVYGDTLCELIDPSLTCASSANSICVRACENGGCIDGYSCLDPRPDPDDMLAHENACLPNGSFPGSPCGANDACAENVGGNETVDMTCLRGQCAVKCPGNGDSLCSGVSPVLTCAESVAPDDVCVLACGAGGTCPTGSSCLGVGSENACLPNGSFPFSQCGANNACDSGLTCSAAAGTLCVPSCASAACPAGLSCKDPEKECLPDGTFPGSACRGGTVCDQDIGGNPDLDLTCYGGTTCLVSCMTVACAAGYTCMTDACVPNPP